MTPLVSVVIPAIRDDLDLRQAIESVLADGYPELEVIVVWDAAPGTALPEPLPGVRYVRSGGIGTPGANNLGLDLATGDFVARLDADDISLPGRFGAQVAALQASPEALLCVTHARVINAAGEVTGAYRKVSKSEIAPALLRANPLLHSSFMFRQSNLRYDLECVRMQDYELALRIAMQSSIVVVEEELVEYRVHERQTGRITSAFWQYIPRVLRARRCLASHLGRSRGAQAVRDTAWFVVQYTNYKGWRDRYASLTPKKYALRPQRRIGPN